MRTKHGERGSSVTDKLKRQVTRASKAHPISRLSSKLREPSACETCGALYKLKKWHSGVAVSYWTLAKVAWTICPACRQIGQGEAYGRIDLKGAFLKAHHDEITSRIRNVSERAERQQSQRRLISMVDKTNDLEVLTTSQKLAHRIAHELRKAFAGTVTYAWDHDDGALRATWQRD